MILNPYSLFPGQDTNQNDAFSCSLLCGEYMGLRGKQLFSGQIYQ